MRVIDTRRLWCVVVSILISSGALVLGCTRSNVSPGGFILISIDTLRADHLGCYGYSRPTSPALDALAAEGVVFEEVVANAPWTLPSHGSMLTGLYPRHHGLVNHRSGLLEEIPTLAETLLEAGFATMSLVAIHYLTDRTGLDRGFERFHYFSPGKGRPRRMGRKQVDQAIEWLRETGDRPFFMFLHNFDVHSNYDPSPEFEALFARPYEGTISGTTRELRGIRRAKTELSQADVERLVDLYDAGIRQVDAELSRLFDYLDGSGLAERTVVIVVSDHGEEFLEHGSVLHGRTMFEELLRVPLIVRGPGLPSGVRIRGIAQPSDLFPTVLELAGVPLTREVDGESLAAGWLDDGGRLGNRLAYAEADQNNRQSDIKRMVRAGRFKLHYDRLADSTELYDLEADPGETRDLAEEEPQVVRGLQADLQRYLATSVEAVKLPRLTKEQLKELRALGYLN